jgi:hypothetical protein
LILTLFITLSRYALLAKSHPKGDETMSDPVTQVRLSMRLEVYLREYLGKNVSNENLSQKEWDAVWKVADAARTRNTLTPELVDDVRVALNKL